MTIRGLDPSGELGRLFSHIQSKEVHARETGSSRTTHQPHSAPDPVDLSMLAQEIRDYSSRAAQGPELRMDAIQRIQRRLNSGVELATAGQVADALTREIILHAWGSHPFADK